MNKPIFRYNKNGVKSSCDQYRNIKGVHYIHCTSNPSDFEQATKESSEKGLKTKIIKDELYVEQK